MSRGLWTGASIVGSLFLMGACGSSSSDGGGAKNVPLSDVPPLYADALCSALEACLGGVMDSFLGGADCREVTTARIQDDFASLSQAVADGRAKYDGTKIQACASAIEALGCAIDQAPEACVSALDGTVAVGDDCTRDYECKGSDTYCKVGSSCPGTCAQRESAGAGCSDDDHCAVGLKCTLGKCAAPATAGQACGGSAGTECAMGLLCSGGDDGEVGTCLDVDTAFSAKEGEDCFTNAKFCELELRCTVEGYDPVAQAVIAKCRKPVAAGAACNPGFPDPCPTGQYCSRPSATSFDGTCSASPTAGQPCASDLSNEPAICAPGLACDGGTCRALQNLGGPCQNPAACYSEKCDGGKCVPGNGCEP